MPPSQPVRVAIAAYEGVSLLDLSGPLEALRVASTHPNHLGTSLIYECSVHSDHGGLVRTADGVRIATEPLIMLDGHAIDTLIVPAPPGPTGPEPARMSVSASSAVNSASELKRASAFPTSASYSPPRRSPNLRRPRR